MDKIKGLELAESIRQEMVKDIDYTTIANMSKPFLTQSGASKLAEGFGYKAELADVREYNTDSGECRITVILNIIDIMSNEIISGAVGTWDSAERGSPDRQRGMQMAYKRAYVMGMRYATFSHELFTQDEDIVRADKELQSAPTRVVVNEDTGEKKEVKNIFEMEWDKSKDDYVFTRYGAKVKGKTVKEAYFDSNVGKGYLEWILNLGSDPSKTDNQGNPEKPCSMGLRELIVKTINDINSGVEDEPEQKVAPEKPDTPDIDTIAQVNYENRST